MEAKKTPKADLESRRGVFTQIGLVVVLAIVLTIFNWKCYDAVAMEELTRNDVIVEEEMVEITQQEKPPALPPPPQQPLLFHEVEDDVEVETDIEIDAEADANTEVMEWTAPVVEAEVVAEDDIFEIVEQNPEYPGGDEARLRFLKENTKYPQMAREAGIQGSVFVGFVVEKDGSITQVKLLRGIGGGCDEEAIRVTKMMPKWKPGQQRGKPVRVSYRMPIKFILQD